MKWAWRAARMRSHSIHIRLSQSHRGICSSEKNQLNSLEIKEVLFTGINYKNTLASAKIQMRHNICNHISQQTQTNTSTWGLSSHTVTNSGFSWELSVSARKKRIGRMDFFLEKQNYYLLLYIIRSGTCTVSADDVVQTLKPKAEWGSLTQNLSNVPTEHTC